MTAERYDYVVVGAGSAGCAAAARLSEDPDVTVAVVEAGPPAKGRLFEIPRLFGLQLKTTFDWDLQTEPEAKLGGRRNYLPRGRVIGGTIPSTGLALSLCGRPCCRGRTSTSCPSHWPSSATCSNPPHEIA